MFAAEAHCTQQALPQIKHRRVMGKACACGLTISDTSPLTIGNRNLPESAARNRGCL